MFIFEFFPSVSLPKFYINDRHERVDDHFTAYSAGRIAIVALLLVNSIAVFGPVSGFLSLLRYFNNGFRWDKCLFWRCIDCRVVCDLVGALVNLLSIVIGAGSSGQLNAGCNRRG